MRQILRAVNQEEEFEDGLSSQVVQLSMIRPQAKNCQEYSKPRAGETGAWIHSSDTVHTIR